MARPRKHPEGTTAADRNREALARLREAGGTRKVIDLSGEAVAALAAIRQATAERSDREVIERLLLAERERLARA
ncbi:hypothetical protein [Azospirillum picis]|uniref:Uncharacterized protein n=1 Tax=Azospirillum picis TaxID=488438 RepID=A0ABU0MRZ4_9PROT|nr:hypothetical protein [Azospirillum picis]MBP2302503.1 hypothetical protein [Azospirillum picis]MDQ0536255.1 hypothetical protein [Azospirillum picis]